MAVHERVGDSATPAAASAGTGEAGVPGGLPPAEVFGTIVLSFEYGPGALPHVSGHDAAELKYVLGLRTI
jgi:hypothetical protein